MKTLATILSLLCILAILSFAVGVMCNGPIGPDGVDRAIYH